jgi:sugar phosphate isomerase/epimerase
MSLLPAVQCSTGPFWAYALERALDAVAEAGFTEIELMITRDPRTHEPDLPARLAEERGLKIASVHGPFLVITKSVWGLDPVRKIERGVDFCRAVGATTYIVHPPYLWEREFARWLRDKCEEVSESSGVKIAVETMYPRWVAGRRLRGHRWLKPEELVAAAPYVVMDTSHLTVGRHDILDAYEVMRPKLVHIHLSDNAGDGRDGHLELEQGVLPLGRFLAEVARTQYSGAISLELTVRRYLENPGALVEMLGRNREFVAAKLSSKQRLDKGLPRDPIAGSRGE